MLVHDKPTYPYVETPKAPSLSKHQHRAPQSSTTGSQQGTGPEDLVGFSRCASPHSCCTLTRWLALFLFELQQQLLALGRSTSGRIGKEAATLIRTQCLLALIWYSFLLRLAYRTVITNSMELYGKNNIQFEQGKRSEPQKILFLLWLILLWNYLEILSHFKNKKTIAENHMYTKWCRNYPIFDIFYIMID